MHHATEASPLGDRLDALDVGRRIKLRATDRARHQQSEHALGVHRVQHIGWQFARCIDARRGGRQQRRQLAGPGDVVGRSAGLVHVHRVVPRMIWLRTLHRRSAWRAKRRQCVANCRHGRTFCTARPRSRPRCARPHVGPVARRLSPRVAAALAKVRREAFVAPGSERAAYENRPLPIGHGQTISQPFIVALMTELLDLRARAHRARGGHRLRLSGGGACRACRAASAPSR